MLRPSSHFLSCFLASAVALAAQEPAPPDAPTPRGAATPQAAPAATPAAPAQPSAPTPAVPAPRAAGPLSSGESDYVLVVGDVVELNIFREPDLATQAIIARDGTVQLPLVREVRLAGMTIRDAREMLRAAYDKQFLVNPQIFLNVVKYAQRKFTIMGQVARPGSYELQGGERMDILEAIGLAGGFTRIANRGRVVIQRKEGGQVKAFKVNAKRMADGKEEPVEVRPGDVITVTESWF